ncbi:Alcohol dehydrogenase GroES-like domain-containing protein [Cladophialophora immunda]|nr:Alcohol dehydrogenase GroES-like domain-containing protein [Cladophialophora immunda]
MPNLRPGYLLVKVAAVALNPTDWKHIDWHNRPNLLCGCDYAGTVAAVGSKCSTSWAEGDRVCGMAHGGNKSQPEDGAFAEYIVAKADVQLRIPTHMSFAEAATLGVGILTVGQGLYQAMGLELPVDDKGEDINKTTTGQYVLVYGGSTASGALGIQSLLASGYLPITTCSPHNFQYVSSLGAVAAFDYRRPDCAQAIKSYTAGNLRYAWDCISTQSSAQICADALALAGEGDLRYGCLLPVDFPRTDVLVTHTLAYTAIGEPFDQGWAKLAAGDTKDFEFARKWVTVAQGLLERGLLKPHEPKIQPGGLEGVVEGLDILRKDSVSGQKLVYEL